MAGAQEVEPPADDLYEITVYGDGALRQARWDAILKMKALGWEPIEKSGGRVVFKPPRRWMGRAELDREGDLDFRYPFARLKRVKAVDTTDPPDGSSPGFDRDPGGMVFIDGATGQRTNTLPAGQASLWLLPSRRILDAAYAKVRKTVQPELQRIDTLQRDTLVRERLDALPGELDALWRDGIALDGGARLETREERVEAVLRFWGTRADTFEGKQVTRSTEGWIQGVLYDAVQISETQRAEAEALRVDGRTLP